MLEISFCIFTPIKNIGIPSNHPITIPAIYPDLISVSTN
jgi:hypothetical protein